MLRRKQKLFGQRNNRRDSFRGRLVGSEFARKTVGYRSNVLHILPDIYQ